MHYKTLRIEGTGPCDDCEILYINGLRCHETGCRGRWMDEIRECQWCGEEFQPYDRGQTCCSHSCGIAYHGFDCQCTECADDCREPTLT